MKSLTQMINEAGSKNEYRVEFIGSKSNDGTPITVTCVVDNGDIKGFERFLKDNQDDIFSHAEGGSIEY